MDPLETKFDVFQAQLVAKALKKKYKILTVAYCKGMTPRGLAYEVAREIDAMPKKEDAIAKEIASAARLM